MSGRRRFSCPPPSAFAQATADKSSRAEAENLCPWCAANPRPLPPAPRRAPISASSTRFRTKASILLLQQIGEGVGITPHRKIRFANFSASPSRGEARKQQGKAVD